MKNYIEIIFVGIFSLLIPLGCNAAVGLPWSTTYDCSEWTQSDGTPSCDGLTSWGSYTTLSWDSAASWTEETGIGNDIWSMNATFNRDRMVIEGTEYSEAANSSAIDSTNRWYSDSPTLYLYSVGNPASTYSKIGSEEQITSDANNPNGGGGKGQRHWVGDGVNITSGAMRIEFTSRQSELWVRWYMRYEAGFKWDPIIYDKILYFDPLDAHGVSPQFKDSDKVNIASSTPPYNHLSPDGCGWPTVMGGSASDGLWHCWEVHMKAASGSIGIGEMWIDGVQKIDLADIDYGTTLGWIYFVIGSNQRYPDNNCCMAVDFDDIAVSNTGYIGPLESGSSAGSHMTGITPSGCTF